MANIRFKDYLKDYLLYFNITNKDFANRLNISEKHLISILSGSSDLSSKVIENLAIITNIDVEYINKIEREYYLEKNIRDYLKTANLTETEFLKKFKYKYLIDSDYIELRNKFSKICIIKDLLKFLRVPTLSKIYKIDEKALYKSNNDKHELLLLWLEKCYRETLNQKIEIYKKENIEILVKFILKQANDGIFNEESLRKKFNENGIFLVIQGDIPGSKIRGAFKVHRDAPAIYLTYKHKRIADIYFALLHELAHCKTDFNKAKATSLVSYDDNSIEEVENKADNQAYDWMVEDNYYREAVCNNRFYNVSSETRYPKSFIVYRMAKDNLIKYESSKYQKYNFLLEKIKPFSEYNEKNKYQ